MLVSRQKNRKLMQVAFISVLLLVIFNVKAEEVTLSYKKYNRHMLNADFNLADGNAENDDVVLITHGALAHKQMEIVKYLNRLFLDKGYNTLAINLSLGINNRHGMYDCSVTHRHTNNDAVEEIEQWVFWLIKKGIKNIYLLGHSRGGAQVALFSSTSKLKQIKAVALMAPATSENTAEINYKKRYQQELKPILDNARKLKKQGKKHAVLKSIGLMSCNDTSATAESFLSYYGQQKNVDTPSLLKKIIKPVVIVVAGDDKVVISLDKKIRSITDNKFRKLSVIEGADHMFRDLNADDAVDSISEFFQSVNSSRDEKN